jgi:hypothetical protein
VVIGTVTTDATGAFQFIDTANATKPYCSYRLRAAQPLPTVLTLPATSGAITGSFVALNDAISQGLTTDATTGGRAAYTFTVATASNYVVKASVNAPTTTNNSFYVNIDAEPTDPIMIWDIPVTTGFMNRFVSWRGNGTPDVDQFVPQIFALSAGTHQLVIRGREANTQLGMITIEPLTAAAPTVQIKISPNKQVVLTGTGLPNCTYQVLCSVNLTTWVVIGTVTTDATGAFQFIDTANATKPYCSYRLRG